MKWTISVCLAMAGAAFSTSYQTWKMKVDGKDRNLVVYAPSGLTKPPLILQLHGMNQDAAYQQAQAKWENYADTGKFIVVLPNGLNKSWDLSGNTDVNFMTAIIDTMAKAYGADRDRVYISGFSMGGMFTYHAMNKLSDKIAAFAPCSGYPLGGTTASSSRPVPILHIHGTSDDVVAYSGVEGALSKWRSWNGCPTTKTTIKPYPSNKSGSGSTRDDWGPCTKNGRTVQVSLITNANKGHWYSMDAAGAMSSPEIWNFSKPYSLSTSSGIAAPLSLASTLAIRVEEGAIRLESREPLRSVRILDLQGRVKAAWNGGASGVERMVSIPSAELARGIYVVEAQGLHDRAGFRIATP